MSVLIKGMEMPTSCAECWLMDGEDSWCCACRGRHLYPEYRYGIKDRPEWCPLVPDPPHGRLIDAEDLFRKIKAECNPYGNQTIGYEDGLKVLRMIENSPTIIPAEEE